MRLTRLIAIILSLTFSLVNAAAAQGQVAATSGQVSKTGTAVGYQIGQGTTVDLKGTEEAPQASGEAKVEAKKGITEIDAKVTGMPQPTKWGAEFLTYVLWVVSPDGRTSNVGEFMLNNSNEGKLSVTTQLQTFSLIVTAEPYFSVRQPSEVVVLENATRKNTKGKIFPIQGYMLMKRAQYQKMGNPLALTLDLKNVPLEMYEARNSVEIAKFKAADKYAPEIDTKAESSLKMAENALASKADKKVINATCRQTVQFSEDALALSVQRQEEERIKNEREAAAAKAKSEAEAKAAAEAAQAKAAADARAAEAKRRADEEARRQAEIAAAKQAQMKAESDMAAMKAKSEADALRAKEEAAKAEADRAIRAAEELRARLLDQFNRILETRDTPRGLVVNMADVLFDTGKYDLRGEAREKLARLSGIILANPGLNLTVEGHTDSTGSDELNQKLSEQRAGGVRTYLIAQGLADSSITAAGFGKTMPVADNTSAAGRQKNRRVEIIVSGDVIGTKIGK